MNDETAGKGALNEKVEVDGTCRGLSWVAVVAGASTDPCAMFGAAVCDRDT